MLFWLLFQVPVLANCKGLRFLTSRPPWTPSVRCHVPIIVLLCPPLGGWLPSGLSWEKRRRKPAVGLGSQEDQVTECTGKWRGKALPRRESRALRLHPRGRAVHRSGTQSTRSGSLRPHQQGLWVYISKKLTLWASLWILGGEGATRSHQNFFIISMLSNSFLPPSRSHSLYTCTEDHHVFPKTLTCVGASNNTPVCPLACFSIPLSPSPFWTVLASFLLLRITDILPSPFL